MKNNTRALLILLLRIFLGGIFIYAGIGKMIRPDLFVIDIDNYRLLPYLLVSMLAVILPWVEFVCGVLLFAGRWLRGASLLLVVMNVVFILAIGSAMARGLDISCGCFSLGTEGATVGWQRLGEDIVFLAGSLLILKDSAERIT